MFGASALGLNPIPRPDVDRDLDKEQKRGKCKYLSVGQQFGRFLCHAQYATSLSQVPREMRITDPNGISVDYDAMDKMLYGIYLGGFVLYMKGTDETVFVSNRFLVDRENSRSVGDCIYGTVQEAQAGVAAYTRPDDKTPRHAYYWGGGGKYIVPAAILDQAVYHRRQGRYPRQQKPHPSAYQMGLRNVGCAAMRN
jgi:hypothetical protein